MIDPKHSFMPWRALAFGAAIVGSISPVHAQSEPQRTKASAQTFLMTVLPAQSATISWLGVRNTWNGVWRELFISRQENFTMPDDKSIRSVVTLQPLEIRSVSSNNDCLTTIAIHPRPSQHREPSQYRTVDIDGSPYGPFTINWKNVSEVYKSEGGSSIELRGLSTPIMVNLASPQLAVRVHFAMEFLRMNCDVAAQTGF